jgi:hypothetical protein
VESNQKFFDAKSFVCHSIENNRKLIKETRMKHSFMFKFLCVSTILFSFNCFAGSQYPEVTIKPFPIMTWVPPALNEQQLGWYKQAGFNVMFIYPEEDAYKKMKSLWDGNWMVFKEWNPKGYDYKTMCDFHADDAKRIGFMLGDEPITPKIDEYAEQYDYLRSKHPDDICLVNLFPSYVARQGLEAHFVSMLISILRNLDLVMHL